MINSGGLIKAHLPGSRTTSYSNSRSEDSSIFSSATASESKADLAADPEWHKHILRRLQPHNRCRMEIASITFDEIENRSDGLLRREPKSQDRKGLSRESKLPLRSRTTHRIARPTRGLPQRPRVLLRSWFRSS